MQRSITSAGGLLPMSQGLWGGCEVTLALARAPVELSVFGCLWEGPSFAKLWWGREFFWVYNQAPDYRLQEMAALACRLHLCHLCHTSALSMFHLQGFSLLQLAGLDGLLDDMHWVKSCLWGWAVLPSTAKG